MKKRIFSILTALALCLTLLPATALAVGTDTAADKWDGTPDMDWWWHWLSTGGSDTYTISTAAQLAGLASLVNEGNADFSGITIKLGADIDLGGCDWTPIGYYVYRDGSRPFKGTFDGQGHTVKGLSVDMGGDDGHVTDNTAYYSAGLFGYVSYGTVQNLNVEGTVEVDGSGSGIVYAGGVVGVVDGTENTVENCSFSGTVEVTASSACMVGGVVGLMNFATVENCYHTGSVVSSDTGSANIGGVVGVLFYATVKNCYHIGSAVSSGTGSANIGGVVGNANFSPTVENCYFLQEGNGSLQGIGSIEYGGSNTGAEPKTENAFASGEVAWLLQNGQTGTVWVQMPGTEEEASYPALAALLSEEELKQAYTVYQVTFIAGENTTYKYTNSAGQVTAPDLPTGGDYVGWYDGDTKYAAGATITVGSSDIALLAKTQESTPNIEIDYKQELLTGFDSGVTYIITIDGNAEGTEVTLDENNTLSVEEYMGKAVSIVRKSASETSVDSEPWTKDIPARPGAPTGVQGVNETVDGNHDGKITGVTTAMEYKLSTAGSWTKCTGTEVTGLAPGKYQVRLAATNSDFASAAADVTIATGAARTYTLNVTAPTFDSAAYGYAQPAAKAITISNSGNSASAISGVALSGDTSAFTLNKTDGATVQPGAMDNTTYTIQPAAGLNAGTYTATITVTYQDGETATATVSFTVTQAAQEAPAAPELASRTTSRITLKTVAPNANGAAAEYGISTDGGATWAWQASPEFTKLSSGKEYTFAVRYSATEDGNYATSPASDTAAFSTARHSVIVPVTPDVPPVVVTPTYPPAVDPADNGSVSVTPASPTQGDTVTVTPNPDRGYEVDSITVTDQNGNPVKVTDNGDGTYSFTQPAEKVTISVAYVCDGLTDSCPSFHFADVDTTKWYHLAVDFVVENGLMNGYDNGLFGPNDTLTRAELAQILYNKEGRPSVSGSVFTDVAENAWYADAVTWANRNGIVGGYGNGRFGPGDPITREQLAVMLWRYAGCPAVTQKELRFTDADQVSDWALEAMLWATENGVVNGYSGVLNPGGTATRAEAAQMLKNFLENI